MRVMTRAVTAMTRVTMLAGTAKIIGVWAGWVSDILSR
jgi:hypothetical protein